MVRRPVCARFTGYDVCDRNIDPTGGTEMAELSTVFVLGAGFSVEEQYPLVRTLKNQVVHFLEAELHSAYRVFLQPGNGGFPRGQFYAGLQAIDPDGKLQFEELLLTFNARLKNTSNSDPCYVTAQVLR